LGFSGSVSIFRRRREIKTSIARSDSGESVRTMASINWLRVITRSEFRASTSKRSNSAEVNAAVSPVGAQRVWRSEVPACEAIDVPLGFASAIAAQQISHPRDQFPRLEWLDEIVVRSHFERGNAVVAAASTADDEDRQIGPGPQRAHDGEPVLIRKIEIEEDAVEAGTRHTAEGVASMGHKGGFVSRSIEIGRHDGAERRIIFDNQQSGFAWNGHDRHRLVFGTLW
jgi:hypothetical protein